MNKNAKILVVVPKYDLTEKKFYHYLFPTGYAYIIAALKKLGGYKNVECLNLNHEEGKIQDIVLERLLKGNYDYMLFGGIVLDFNSMVLTLKAIDKLKENNIQKPIIILGGMFVTTMTSEAMQEFSQVDYGVLGEAEETIVDLIDTLEKGGDVSKVTGIVYREKR